MGASNTPGLPITITSPNHGLLTGDRVLISGVQGFAAANGFFTVGNVTTISLNKAPQGYKDFDKGAAKKYVIDPHGMVKGAAA